MADWPMVLLGSHADVRARIGWRGLSSDEYTDDGPYLIAGKHIINGNIDWQSCDHLSQWRYEESPEIALRNRDVVVSKDGTIGRVARIDALPGPATLNGTMMLVRPHEQLDHRFLAHSLGGQAFQKLIADRISGSSIPHLFQRDLVELKLRMPPLEEQRRIAEILDALDATIQATERVIVKLIRMRCGIVDELLSALPIDGSLDAELIRIDAGWSPTCIDRIPIAQEWGVLKVSSITSEIFDPSESKTLSAGLHYRPELKVNVGDVLAARANGVAELVARTSIVEDLDQKNLMISDKTLRLVPKPTLSARYLTYCMQHEMVRQQVRGLVSGSTGQGNISQKELRTLQLAVPEYTQQLAIEQKVNAIDGQLAEEKNWKSKLHQIRQGLAGDLLSGRVRTVVE